MVTRTPQLPHPDTKRRVLRPTFGVPAAPGATSPAGPGPRPTVSATAVAAVPADFIEVVELSGRLSASALRRLGYFGEARFTIFYYEPRAEEVVWEDRHTHGFGTGGWQTFLDDIVPLARRYGVDLCAGVKAVGATAAKGPDAAKAEKSVLITDRATGTAWVTGHRSARRFVAAT